MTSEFVKDKNAQTTGSLQHRGATPKFSGGPNLRPYIYYIQYCDWGQTEFIV